jgi:undecaprenyl-diphosphatase
MINIFQALVLGVVEGLTEFLPISSTGHLVLFSQLLGVVQSDYAKTFEIAIQGGAILAVLVLYWRHLLNWRVWRQILIAFIPTGIVGLFLYKVVKTYLLGNVTIVLWALGLGGLLLIIFEYFYQSKFKQDGGGVEITQLSPRQLLSLGLWQCCALIPGVSRSAATVVGGLLMGLPRSTIVEFSFLLAVPTLLAATGLDVINNIQLFSSNQALILLVGLVTAFVVALVSIRWLLNYVQNNNFITFGAYRIILAVVMWFVLL